MLEKHYGINKYASIINRLGMIYFDQMLAPYQIASGQQIFLLYISDHPGVSILELATHAKFDKGTTARAVQRLEEQGFIYRQADEQDKRIQRLYMCEKGMLLLPVIRHVLHDWECILLQDIKEEEILSTLRVMKQMSNNANEYMQERKRDHDERNINK